MSLIRNSTSTPDFPPGALFFQVLNDRDNTTWIVTMPDGMRPLTQYVEQCWEFRSNARGFPPVWYCYSSTESVYCKSYPQRFHEMSRADALEILVAGALPEGF